MSDMLQLVVEIGISQYAMIRIGSPLECCESRRQAEACRTLRLYFSSRSLWERDLGEGLEHQALSQASPKGRGLLFKPPVVRLAVAHSHTRRHITNAN